MGQWDHKDRERYLNQARQVKRLPLQLMSCVMTNMLTISCEAHALNICMRRENVNLHGYTHEYMCTYKAWASPWTCWSNYQAICVQRRPANLGELMAAGEEGPRHMPYGMLHIVVPCVCAYACSYLLRERYSYLYACMYLFREAWCCQHEQIACEGPVTTTSDLDCYHNVVINKYNICT